MAWSINNSIHWFQLNSLILILNSRLGDLTTYTIGATHAFCRGGGRGGVIEF